MNKKNINHGFTLIEVIVAITVLAVGILSLTEIFPFALKISRSAEQQTVAVNLAQAKIEEMFYLDYENISTGTIEARQRMSDEPANPFYYYERETLAEHVDGDLNTSVTETGMKKITTTVYWDSPFFVNEKNTELSIIISEK